jgi:chorismate dehydratase
MEKIRVSIVSYLNSKPFLYGLMKSPVAGQMELGIDIPSKVASKLMLNLVDVGLIPVGALGDLDYYKLVGDYCIGARGNVRTVLLASEVPLEKVDTILLDYQSRTSVLLVKVLARFFWKKNFNWEKTCVGFENRSIGGTTAGVVIGDRVFSVESKYKYTIDLSEEWVQFTRLPFVFAVWAANKDVSKQFESDFNEALDFGVNSISEIVHLEQANYPEVDIHDYFSRNLSFKLDEQKKAGMRKFLELAKKLESVELA